MRFAINYSPQAEALLRDGMIAVDLWKCPDWPDLIETARNSRPVYVHFPLDTGTAPADLERVEGLRRETETPFINLHLLAQAADFPEIPAQSRSGRDLAAVTAQLIRQVERVTQRFGAERVMVENLIYRGPEGKYLLAGILPEVIGAVVRETGCRLLLDTAHATIAARHLGVEPREYIAQLPVEALRELHITGVAYHSQRWRDHLPMTEADFALAGWVLEQIREHRWPEPWVVSLEYGGIGPAFEWRSEASVIAEQAPRLLRLVRRP
ncbi:MAG: DUF692 family multinuclear iron-containing protein [Bacillota bacterium]